MKKEKVRIQPVKKAEKEHTERSVKARVDKKKQPHDLYDIVFRTIVEYLRELIIPVINEIFGTDYPADAKLKVLKNEHHMRFGRLVTDLTVELGGRVYQAECQSWPDGRMVVRVSEYALAFALGRAKRREDGSYEMRVPETCVLYIRSTGRTPDSLTMHIKFPGDREMKLNVPMLKLRDYTRDELFRRNLLMLLPFYLVRYENECRMIGRLSTEQQAEADRRITGFVDEYRALMNQLAAVCEKDEQQYLYLTLADLTHEVAVYLAPQNEKERINALKETIIKTRAQILVEKGKAQGITQGIALKTLADQVHDNALSVEQAAARMSLSAGDFTAQCRKYGLSL